MDAEGTPSGWLSPPERGLLRAASAVDRVVQHVRLRAHRRRATGVVPPVSPVPPVSGRGWVFAVCGGASHVEALCFAVEHLRPRTSLPIVVVTDQSRNSRPVALAGVEVVDVATPRALDHHQAAIWLKTSLHRLLPAGEWCYLDSDVMAVDRGVDELFDHRRTPVAFASDLPIAGNDVDRFSPHAMTCPCTGTEPTESCAHLREQLRERLGLEVPPWWVPWNGGVFAFDGSATPFLDRWHELAVQAFDWPEWRTRDQHALIATVWEQGLQDQDRLPLRFNFIVDFANNWLGHDPAAGWRLHPDHAWSRPVFLHLFSSPVGAAGWEFRRDVVLRAVRRTARQQAGVRAEERAQAYAEQRSALVTWWYDVVVGGVKAVWFRGVWPIRRTVRRTYWVVRNWLVLWVNRGRRLPGRLRPARLAAAARRRWSPPAPEGDGDGW